MAQESKSAWGLWSSLVETVTTTVKQKSDEIINIYKEDLQEFSRTIVSDTSAVIKDKVDMLSQADKKATKTTNTSHQMARVLRIQRDPKSYSEQPNDEEYTAWSTNFNVGAPENTEAITHLLTTNEIVREFHTAMVPTKVLYRDFWCRYYYRIHKLGEEEKRRAAILKNANANDDDEFSWDVEDESTVKTNSPSAKHIPSDTTTAPISSGDTPTNESPTNDSKDTTQEDNENDSWSDKDDDKVDAAKEQKEKEQQADKEEDRKEEAKTEEGEGVNEKDEIDEEIARKFESQKLDKADQKSDVEDGWADWE